MAPDSPSAEAVQLRLADAADQPTLQALFTAHLEFLHGFNAEVDPALELQSDWTEKPGVLFPWLIESRDGVGPPRPVGLALMGEKRLASALGSDADFFVYEFHVAADARGKGIGSAGVRALMEEHPGTWCLDVLPQNSMAVGFWNAVFRGLPVEIVKRDVDGVTFDRYTVGPKA